MTVGTALVPATRADAPVLARLFQLYAYDFSEVTGQELDASGTYVLRDVVRFWDEPHYEPLFIHEDGVLSGFAITSKQSRLWPEQRAWDMAEFFVVRKHRRKGVGARAAAAVFAARPGRWEVRELAANASAATFWRAVIAQVTGGVFEELVLDDERWRGPVQIFVSR